MYIAIIKTENNRIAKYQEFPNLTDANTHVATYGGFVYNNTNNYNITDLYIDNNQTVTFQIPEPTTQMVNDERNRRILLPKPVSLTSGKSFSCDMANGGRENIGDLGTAALAKLAVNNTDTIPFRDSNNTDWNLTNVDIMEMGLQIMNQVSALHIKCRVIKDSDPIPVDYTDDSYWT